MKNLSERIEDALREVGTLVIAFTPLDAAFSQTGNRVGRLLLFGLYGLVLFIGALWLERRRSRDT